MISGTDDMQTIVPSAHEIPLIVDRYKEILVGSPVERCHNVQSRTLGLVLPFATAIECACPLSTVSWTGMGFRGR